MPQNITLNTSAPLVLSCDASGFPEPKIRWEKSGTTLSHAKQLNISSSNRNDAGEYACIASNGVRQEKTAWVYVTVKCKSFLQYFIKSCQWSVLEVPNFFLLNWCNFDKKRKIVHTFKLQHFRKRVYLYICINLPKRTQKNNKLKVNIHENILSKLKISPTSPHPQPKWSGLLGGMLQSNLWLWINGKRLKQIQPNKNSNQKGNPPWAFYTKTFASHP